MPVKPESSKWSRVHSLPRPVWLCDHDFVFFPHYVSSDHMALCPYKPVTTNFA